MEKLGYTNYYQVLNAKDYGIPQNRERVFTISILGKHNTFEFPIKQELKLKLKDMLEDEVDEKYYLSDKMISYVLSSGTKTFYYKPEIDLEIARPLSTDQNKRSGTTNYFSEQFLKKDEKLLIKEATKQGYKEAYEGDSVNLEQPNSKTRRGRVGNQVAQTLTTSCNQAVVEPFITKKYKEFEKDKGYTPNMFNPYNKAEINNIAPTQSTQCGSTTSSATVLIKNDLKIRKLTPKECFRLMGFDDEDFEKASQVNSNAQLYKQAGNSICVNVLEAILKKLL